MDMTRLWLLENSREAGVDMGRHGGSALELA